MEGRRRRAQRLEQAQPIEEQPQQEEFSPQEQPMLPKEPQTQSAPPRRRRVQPPQQITQRVPKVDVPQGDEPQESAPRAPEIPRMPVMEETPEPVKRYKKTGKKSACKPAAAPAIDTERLGRLAGAAKDTGKTVAAGLGGILLLAVMTAGKGIGKLSEALKKAQRAGCRKDGAGAQAEQEYELEAIRPEDYHGRGKAHAQNSREHSIHTLRSAKGRALNVNRIATVLFACIALVSLYQIGAIVLRSLRTNRLNDELSQRRAQLSSEETTDGQTADEQTLTVFSGETTQIAVPTPEPTAEPIAVPLELAQDVSDTAQAVPQATDAPDVVTTMKYHQVGGDALPEMAALYEDNRDLIAWMEIPDVLDLPIVYRDNSYYLTRDFYKQKNASGTIFLDENHPFREKTQNLLLHGHNMKDGTMFGRLAQYLYDNTYIKNHPFIYFNTLWKKEQYVIFAILNVSLDVKNERFFNYFTHATFFSDAEFSSYIRQLQLRSEYAIPVDVQPGDALLTLSTCLDDDRLVIVARRLRSGEARSDLRPMMQTVRRQ